MRPKAVGARNAADAEPPDTKAPNAWAVLLAALSLTLLVVTELLIADASLAVVAIDLWGLPTLVVDVAAAIGLVFVVWLGYRIFRAVLDVERDLVVSP